MKTTKFRFIKNHYTENRGGTSQFLNLYCASCGNYLLLYQKDGPGPLKRLYLDRIVAPESLKNRFLGKESECLICTTCNRTIGMQTIYEKEKRSALALFAYMVIKKRGKGIYPPVVAKVAL